MESRIIALSYNFSLDYPLNFQPRRFGTVAVSVEAVPKVPTLRVRKPAVCVLCRTKYILFLFINITPVMYPHITKICICKSRIIEMALIIASHKLQPNNYLSYCASSVFVLQRHFLLVGEAPPIPLNISCVDGCAFLRTQKRVMPVTRYHSNIVIE